MSIFSTPRRSSGSSPLLWSRPGAGRSVDLRVRHVQQGDVPHARRLRRSPDYFDLLKSHNTAHVFNAWTRMPALDDQARLPEAFTADFTVVRALLKKGQGLGCRPELQAVQHDPGTERRGKDRDGGDREPVEETKPAFLFVNNRLEGNAPGTIEAVVNGI